MYFEVKEMEAKELKQDSHQIGTFLLTSLLQQ